MSALGDSLRNGPGERVRPAVSWRRNGNWGRDAGDGDAPAAARAVRFAAITIGTLTIGLGMVAVAYTVVRQDPDRADAVSGCRCAVLRVARLWADRRLETRRAGRTRFHGAAEVRKPWSRTSRRSSAMLGEDLRAARGCRPERDRGDGRHAEPLRAARRDRHARAWLCAERSRARSAPEPDRADARSSGTGSAPIPRSSVRKCGSTGNAYTVIGVLPPTLCIRAQRVAARAAAHRRVHRRSASILRTGQAPAEPAPPGTRPRGTSPQAAASAVDAAGRVDRRPRLQQPRLEALSRRPQTRRRRAEYGPRSSSSVPPSALLALDADGQSRVGAARSRGAARARVRGVARPRRQRSSPSCARRCSKVVCSDASAARRRAGRRLGDAARSSRWRRSICRAAKPIAVDWEHRRRGSRRSARCSACWRRRCRRPGRHARRCRRCWRCSAVRGGGGHGRMRRGMIVAQVALVARAPRHARDWWCAASNDLLRADPGFNPDGLLTVRVRITAGVLPERRPMSWSGSRIAIERRVRGDPRRDGRERGVRAAADGGGEPGAGYDPWRARHHGRSTAHDNAARGHHRHRARRTLRSWGCGYVAGRAFDPVRAGTAGRKRSSIAGLAKQFFPTGNPIGAKIPGPAPDLHEYEPKPADGFTIVGVVEQARLYDVHQDGRPQLYIRTEDQGLSLARRSSLRTGRDPRVDRPGRRARRCGAWTPASRLGGVEDDGRDRGRRASATAHRAR